MTSVEEMLNKWKKGLSIETENDDNSINDKNGFNMLYISLTPRIKWFKPPLWKIFMWAYKIDKRVLLENCVPVSSSSNMESHPVEVELDFKCNNELNYSPEIEKASNKLLENLKKGVH